MLHIPSGGASVPALRVASGLATPLPRYYSARAERSRAGRMDGAWDMWGGGMRGGARGDDAPSNSPPLRSQLKGVAYFAFS